jgi:hypothetical protein
MPTVIKRAAWDTGSDGRRFSRSLQPHRVKGMVLHYPGDGQHTRAGLSAPAVAALLRGYQRFHRQTRGWPDLGYLLAVDQAGRLYEGAGFVVGAHSATDRYAAANHERVGVLLVIGNEEAPSSALRSTVAWLREALPAGRVPLPGWTSLPGCHDLHGHRDMEGAQTRCPGDRAAELIRRGGFSTGHTDAPPAVGPVTPRIPGGAAPGRRRTPDEIVRVQNILAAAGFYPREAIDGSYGPLTVAAVRAYQAGQRWPRMTIDGDFGPRTLDHALWTLELQRALNRWRTSLPRLRLDHDYGDLTHERVAEWQRRNRGGAYPAGMAIDGQAARFTAAGLDIPEHP